MSVQVKVAPPEATTEPLPLLPARMVSDSEMSVKVAVAAFAAARFGKMQLPVPVHPPDPDHPVNVEPVDAAAVRVTVLL